MARFAAFDVGTNTVLMVVAERDAQGRFSPIAERSDITRLGEGVTLSGRLSEVAMARTADVFVRFAQEARALGATAIAAGATSAARDAVNGADFVALIEARAGLALEILPGEVEARLTFRAVQEEFGEAERALVAIDIGGGSTEVAIGSSRGAPHFRVSLKIGSVRLTERFVSAHPIPEEEQKALRAHIRGALAVVPARPDGDVIAVAATATTLFAVATGLEHAQDDDALHGGEVTERMLEAWVPKLSRMSLQERRAVRGLDPRRADVVCAGGFILQECLRQLGVPTCRVSDRGVRWGLLHERFGGGAGAMA